MYKEERINKILDVNDEIFSLTDLENNENKQKEIMNIFLNLESYFTSSRWVYFRGICKDKPYVSLIKNVYKDMNYDLILKRKPTEKLYYIKTKGK